MYESKLAELLKKYQSKNDTLAKNGFFIFENLEEDALLFIGINPSEVKDLTKKYTVTYKNGIYWVGEKFKDEYPFYQHFNELSCGMKWSHLDIYFCCNKKQKDLENMEGSEFLTEQFNISKEIIQKLAPKIIVVGNAYASCLMRKNFNCKLDNDIGTYRIKELNNAPIFFSGMFTGQRALDVGSRERLIWHIKYVICKTMGDDNAMAR